MRSRLPEATKLAFLRLIKPFERSTEDVIKITRAFGIALRIHNGKFRDENIVDPFINHPLKVALLITEELRIFEADLICAALLQDTLGCDEDLLKEFGGPIHEILQVSNMPSFKKEEREKMLSEYFNNLSNSSLPTRYLVLADRLENVRALKNTSHKHKISRYKEETEKYIIPLALKTDENVAFKLSIALYELR
jgi:(p)ppGpp synthase/HD superfamily hydrolase